MGWSAKPILQTNNHGIWSRTMNTDKFQAIEPKKKGYETPVLRVYGNVAEITQYTIKWGSGDLLAAQEQLPDILAAVS
jgi:hypothetical protein